MLQPQIEKYPLCYFLLWRNYAKEFFGPVPGEQCGDDFKTMASRPRALMLKDISK